MFNLDFTQRCLVGECWCPTDSLDDIQAALTRGKVHTLHVCVRNVYLIKEDVLRLIVMDFI